jgi:hypothetical protein
VDLPAVLTAFDEQMRRHVRESPGARVETEERVTRTVGTDGSWSAVVWSRLTEADADEVIADEIARAADASFEWKLYSHDRPADLPARLRAAGLTPEPVETLMVAEIADLDLPVRDPAGVRMAAVDDSTGVAAMLRVHEEVFGPGSVHPSTVEAVRASLELRPRPIEAVIAWAGDVAVSAGRGGVPRRHALRQSLGWRDDARMARPRGVPSPGGSSGRARPGARLPLPAGGRAAHEPADPAAHGLPAPRRDDALGACRLSEAGQVRGPATAIAVRRSSAAARGDGSGGPGCRLTRGTTAATACS